MKKQTFTLILFLVINLLQAQNPLVKQWDKRFGGTDEDNIFSIQQTNDDGYILGGKSRSDSSGNKSSHHWGSQFKSDYWVVKTNKLGAKKWDKNFGGTETDILTSVLQTADGGYILGGLSDSDSSGNKTQNGVGYDDYWIVKIDSLGNKQWDKNYGGTDLDVCSSLDLTGDGGYIFGGSSRSDSSGDKTWNTWGWDDFWIVKTDSAGTKQWDKDFGGTDFDILASLQKTNDGGYILGGFSWSDSSGDKTQSNWDTTNLTSDYWIVKIDALGNKLWDKRFGGTNDDQLYSLQQTTDKGYILGGISKSGISGDKTQPIWGYSDFWIIKIDSLGNKEWDKNFGGTSIEEGPRYTTQTADGGYLMSGDSHSPLSGDKTENNLGLVQTWIVKTDSLGTKLWDKTIFTVGYDVTGMVRQTKDGCYIIGNTTNSVSGGYKSQNNWGVCAPDCPYDFWIIKFCDTTSTGINNTTTFNSQITVYPNLFTSQITITIQKQNLKQTIFAIKNILGQTVFSKQENNLTGISRRTIDLSFLSSGIYLLAVTIDGERTVKKIMKE